MRLECEKRARVQRAIMRGTRIQKGVAFGRVIWTKTVGNREISYYATKGYRSNRA